MGQRNAGLIADPLFVGATRPPMRWGVTYAALLVNLVFTLDTIVREEIRATLLEEMQALDEESRRAAEALRRLQRTANLRLILWSTTVLSLASLLPCAIAWWLLPTRAEIQTLAAKRDELSANIDRLSRQGGNVELRRCGTTQRLCVRVERSAPAYGAAGDFLILKGY